MYKFEIYADRAREYRWRLKAGNGRTIADSGEGYSSKSNAKRAAERARSEIGSASIVEI